MKPLCHVWWCDICGKPTCIIYFLERKGERNTHTYIKNNRKHKHTHRHKHQTQLSTLLELRWNGWRFLGCSLKTCHERHSLLSQDVCECVFCRWFSCCKTISFRMVNTYSVKVYTDELTVKLINEINKWKNISAMLKKFCNWFLSKTHQARHLSAVWAVMMKLKDDDCGHNWHADNHHGAGKVLP